MDNDWNEAMPDVRTGAKRRRIAQTMYAWIDDCAAKRYQAADPDNCDTYPAPQRPADPRRREGLPRALTGCTPPASPSPAPPPSSWHPVWSDDFDGAAGTRPD
ncbi:hypothetical protein JYK04_00379 [Streptomyces nojiriensis]|nr:hypothetical protein JYK04_00379 [Streptomyces nojiriensis]